MSAAVRRGQRGRRGYDRRVRYPVVLFDLDGTLIDSGAIILASFRHAARTVLDREVPDEVLLAHVGGSSLHEQMRALDPLRVDELVHSYREHNEPLHDGLEVFPGIFDALETLRGEGRRLGIVTAKRRVTVDLAFARLPLAAYFDAVVTAEQTELHKPDPEPILLALDRLGTVSADAAYVGDSPFDMGAARAAGVRAVGVTWGGIYAREALSDADVLVDTPEELVGVL
jgi:pyrophosphatase PpaX